MFTSIMSLLLTQLPISELCESDLFELIKCINFAAVKHKDQRRNDKEQTPYINHPIGVAFILTNEGKITNLDVIKAALLHDTVEDTETTYEEISLNFGNVVKSLVAEVTDDKSLPKMERKRLQIEHASKCSFNAKLIKLADKLYNLRDLHRQTPVGWTAERVEEYFKWAKDVIDQIRGTNAVIEAELDKLFSQHVYSSRS